MFIFFPDETTFAMPIVITSIGGLCTLIMLALFARYLFFKRFKPNMFVKLHVIGDPSIYLLFYVIASHLFITICSYYILIWQFILFHNANDHQLIPIIVLESIVFVIKFVIDFVFYFLQFLKLVCDHFHLRSTATQPTSDSNQTKINTKL